MLFFCIQVSYGNCETKETYLEPCYIEHGLLKHTRHPNTLCSFSIYSLDCPETRTLKVQLCSKEPLFSLNYSLYWQGVLNENPPLVAYLSYFVFRPDTATYTRQDQSEPRVPLKHIPN